VREVSKFLNVSEATITRWVKHRGLPAQRVGGQYRFNRTELLEWTTANQIKISLEMFDHLEAEDDPPPILAEAMKAGGIYYQLPGADKIQALQAMVRVLPLPAGMDRELLMQLFLVREAAASTGVGDGIAIPHVRNPIVLQVIQPMVTLCFLEKPVDFGALDGKPVHVLFSLICPTMRSHLQTLARLSYALHDEGFKRVLASKGRPEEILREASRIQPS
jgi:PTS system nitrogen regulatory IIA component